MSKVYGFCDAGCRFRVPTYDEFAKSASIIKVSPESDGTYILEKGYAYKIIGGSAIKFDWQGRGEIANDSGSITIDLPSNTYNKFTCFDDDGNGYYILYELNGERKEASINSTYMYEINYTCTVLSAEEVYIFNEDATITAEDGKSAYEVALAKGFEGTEAEWLASLKGEKGEQGDVSLEYAEATYKKKQFAFADYGLPIVYFEGDITTMTKDNAVTLNYRYGDRSGTCTLKWQGSSSLAYPKKNYTVKFDNAFEAADGWGEEKKYCLKADWIDFSHCRNVGTAKLWGHVVKSRASSDLIARLSALVNGGAIDGFPCFVVINGEWQGIYNFNIPKEGYMFGMGSGTKEAILCADQGTNSGFEGEITLNDGFELEYNSDTFPESEIQTSFNNLINAVLNSDGMDIDTTVAQHLDINSAIDYYIFVAALKGSDMVTKNAIFATYDGVKWFMSAYDLDCTWGLYWDGSKFLEAAYGDEYSNCSFYRLTAAHKLFKLLYTYKKPEIIARYKELRELILSPSYIARHFYNYAKNIPLAAYKAESELWTGIPCTSANNVEQITQWYSERVKQVDAEIAEMDEKVEQVATEGLAYTEYGHPVFGNRYTITGIGTATDTDIVIPKWINDAPVTSIEIEAFFNNTSITSVVIPYGITKLQKRTFSGCTNLKKVTIPSTVKKIEESMFYNSGLEELIIPEDVTVIPSYFVASCKSLKSVKMSNKVVEIKECAFNGCSALESIRLSKNLKILGSNMFNNTPITKLSLPAGLQTISDSACKRMLKLESITIPASVKTIGVSAFFSTWKLAEVIFKGTPESIGENAFVECGASVDGGVQIYVPWTEGAVAGAPWGAPDTATIHYNSTT